MTDSTRAWIFGAAAWKVSGRIERALTGETEEEVAERRARHLEAPPVARSMTDGLLVLGVHVRAYRLAQNSRWRRMARG